MKPRISRRVLRGVWATYDPKTDKIEVSDKLTNIPVPSKQNCIYHEEYHRYLEKLDTKMKDEELICDIWAVLQSKRSEITEIEWIYRAGIYKKFGKLSKLQLYNLFTSGEI